MGVVQHKEQNDGFVAKTCSYKNEAIIMGLPDKEDEMIAAGITKFIANTKAMYARHGLPVPKRFVKFSQRVERLKRESEGEQ